MKRNTVVASDKTDISFSMPFYFSPQNKECTGIISYTLLFYRQK